MKFEIEIKKKDLKELNRLFEDQDSVGETDEETVKELFLAVGYREQWDEGDWKYWENAVKVKKVR